MHRLEKKFQTQWNYSINCTQVFMHNTTEHENQCSFDTKYQLVTNAWWTAGLVLLSRQNYRGLPITKMQNRPHCSDIKITILFNLKDLISKLLWKIKGRFGHDRSSKYHTVFERNVCINVSMKISNKVENFLRSSFSKCYAVVQNFFLDFSKLIN